MKNIRVPHVPALEPLSRYTVEFVGHSGETLRRELAGTDEQDVAKAARRYFAVEHITAVIRQGNVYVTGSRA